MNNFQTALSFKTKCKHLLKKLYILVKVINLNFSWQLLFLEYLSTTVLYPQSLWTLLDPCVWHRKHGGVPCVAIINMVWQQHGV